MSLTRHIFAVAILLGIVSIPLTVRSQTQADKKERTGSVSGRVTINGQAAPGIVVSLRKNESRTPSEPTYRSTTDGEGNYQISGVPAGNYRVAPLAPVFVLNDANVSSSSGKLLLIAAGEVIEGIDFALVRGSVITGRVTDSEDRPLIEQRVDVIPMEPGGSNWFGYLRRMDFQTDDRGIYRIFGLPGGRYKVAVGESENSYYSGYRRGVRYKQTFHPNVNDPDQAAVIELGEGTEATNVDISVPQTLQLYSAKGRIVSGGNGEPLANIQVGLTRIFKEGSRSSGSGGNKSDAQGEFLIENLHPGKYSVTIHTPPESDLHADAVGFEIVDQDVAGLLIRTRKSKEGVSLAGIVVLEGSQKAETANFNEFYLSISAHSEAANDWRMSTTLGHDGGFSFESLSFPSQIYFSLDESPYDANPRNINRRYAVSRVERDGVIQPNIIQLQNGDHIKGLRIVIVAQPAGVIRGEVQVKNGPLPAGARLIIRLRRSGEQYSIRQTETDSRNHFLIAGLAAGSYELSANAYVPGSQQRWPTVKQLVHVEEEVVNDIRVSFDLKQTSDPRSKP